MQTPATPSIMRDQSIQKTEGIATMKRFLLAAICMAGCVWSAHAQQPTSFDWKRYNGETINFLSSNHPWPNALAEFIPEFTKLTGITVKMDTYNENQMRQRLTTLMQTHSSSIDLFMTTPTREGRLFTKAGYYRDLKPLLDDPTQTPADYNYADFTSVITRTSRINNVTLGIPLNIEGPVLTYRRDIFEACHITPPATLDDLMTTAAEVKKCKPDLVPFTSRGMKEALNFTFLPVLNNFGGGYDKPIDGAYLCNAPGIQAIQFYADLLDKYGPPGVTNYTFYQTSELMGQGRAVMSLESTNEYGKVAGYPGRAADTGVEILPPGKASGVQRPTVIGWHIAIPAASKKPGPAWYFILWATSKDMESRLAPKGIAPPRVSVFQSKPFQDWAQQYPGRKEWLAALNQLATKATGTVTPPTDRAPEMSTVIGTAVSRVMLHETDAKTAACDAEGQIKGLLAN
jgi:multiple sugar transport system substrate-binding protein